MRDGGNLLRTNLDHRVDQRVQVRRGAVQLEFAVSDAAEIQQVVDEARFQGDGNGRQSMAKARSPASVYAAAISASG